MNIAKKLSTCLLLCACIITTCGAIAFASVDSEKLAALRDTPYTYIDVNNASSYSLTRDSAKLICNINSNVGAYTRIPVSPDGNGYSYVSVKAANGTIATNSGTYNAGNGYINSNTAYVYGQIAFERIVHSGYRTQSGTTKNYAFWCY